MKIALTALTVSCTLFTVAYGDILDPFRPQQGKLLARDRADITNQVKFNSLAARGFIAGYRRGMYKEINYKNDPKCLDADTQS